MLTAAFIFLFFTEALLFRLLFKENIKLDIKEWARVLATGYAIVVFLSLPFLLLEKWSFLNLLFAQTAFTLFIFIMRWRKTGLSKSMTFTWSNGLTTLFLAILCAISIQKSSIYHLYATHDPSAYLAGALHLDRTGSLFNYDKVQELSETHSELEVLINKKGSPIPTNYGLVGSQSKKSYHGFFTEPLFLAIGKNLFGTHQLLQIHWVHMGVSLFLFAALLSSLLGEKSRWFHLGILAFAVNPLTSLIYREPLSEPLAQLCFLSIIFFLTQLRREVRFSVTALIVASALAVCTRVSGFFYLPFVLLTCFFHLNRKERIASLPWWGTYLVATTTALYFSGDYFIEIASFYLVKATLSPSHPFVWIGGLTLIIGGIFVYLSPDQFRVTCNKILQRTKYPAFYVFLALFMIGLGFRYGKLIFVMKRYYEGFPFVTYLLECLLFYSGPVLSLIGLIYWLRIPLNRDRPLNLFLLGFFPFICFFYFVFRFIPMDLQPNFMRYLIIEFVPLVLAGALVTLRKAESKRPLLVRSGIFFHFIWCFTLLGQINHAKISKPDLMSYFTLRAKVAGIYNPVVVVVEPNWTDMTYLAPLQTAFDIPVLTAHKGLDGEEMQAIKQLKYLGFTPLFVTEKSVSLDSSYEPIFESQDCYEYPYFFLAAPPIELQRHCYHYQFFKHREPRLLAANPFQ